MQNLDWLNELGHAMTRGECKVSRLSRHDSELSGQLKPSVHGVVPTVPTVPTQKRVKGTEQPEFLAPGKGGGQEIDCAAKTESVPLSAATDQITHHNLEPQQQGYECGSCWNLLMHFHAPHPDKRRVFQWACQVKHKPLIVPYGSERVLIAPPECQDWKQWQPRTR